MKRLLGAFMLAAAPIATAIAQAPEAVLDSCRAYAQAEAEKAGTAAATVRLDREGLHVERHARRVGSQPVSALAFGTGAIVYPQGVPIEFSFVCLATGDGRALFFHWTPRPDAPPLAQCRRAAAPAQCLDALLVAAEQDLVQLYAKQLVDSRQADVAAGNELASRAFRASADAFLAYRDAECARRGAAGSEPHKACLVELTRRRAQDLQ
ncbi:MAG: lysozyme inhibitor LprI family protein [Pseudomonadota bacterium]